MEASKKQVSSFPLRSAGFRTVEIYRSSVSPGWNCWPCAWTDAAGAVYVSFQELRIAKNEYWEPVPPAFWEAMGLPAGYQVTLCGGAKDILPETVVMKSEDNGETWRETGRCSDRSTVTFAWASLPDGDLIRVACNDYLAWGSALPPKTYSEISSDGGSTWGRRGILSEGYCTNVGGYRIIALQDGSLAVLATYQEAWQPGHASKARTARRPNIRQEDISALWFSNDSGRNWSGPLCVMPGIFAGEADFAELPSGDLLIVNSTVQGGRSTRQYVRKTGYGWMPGPVYDTASGTAPERLALRNDGLIAGGVRGGKYMCSSNNGHTWHDVDTPEAPYYQPFTIPLNDGRYFTVWHAGGGDEPFGKNDLWIGAHIFGIEGYPPESVSLDMVRNFDKTEGRYVNSYLFALASENSALSGRSLDIYYKKGNSGEWIKTTCITDETGCVKFDLTKEYLNETDPHSHYRICAVFEPGAGDEGLLPAKSHEYMAYAITASLGDLGWT